MNNDEYLEICGKRIATGWKASVLVGAILGAIVWIPFCLGYILGAAQ